MLPGVLNDLRFLLVVLGVQHRVFQPALLQQVGEVLRLLDRIRPHQDRAAGGVNLLYVLRDRLELRLLRAEDDVRLRLTDERLVCRDDEDGEAVDLLELIFLRLRRAGHAADSLVQVEVVLQGDRSERLRLALHHHPFLCFQRLVQAVRVAAIGHQSSGERVDDHHPPVLHDVVPLLLEQVQCAQGGLQVMQRLGVLRRVQVVDRQGLFSLVDPRICQGEALRLLVDLEIYVPLEPADDCGKLAVLIDRLRGRSGDDQRRACLVDQYVVDLIDDREVERPLHLLIDGEDHIVAQVVEPELVVRPVGDVGRVRRLPLFRRDPLLQ